MEKTTQKYPRKLRCVKCFKEVEVEEVRYQIKKTGELVGWHVTGVCDGCGYTYPAAPELPWFLI